jgi:hypothetical protein
MMGGNLPMSSVEVGRSAEREKLSRLWWKRTVDSALGVTHCVPEATAGSSSMDGFVLASPDSGFCRVQADLPWPAGEKGPKDVLACSRELGG